MRSLTSILCVLLLTILAYAADSSPAPAADKVLVLPFDAVNAQPEQKWIAGGVQQNLLAELASMKSFATISGSSAASDADTAVAAGKSAGAKYIVFGSYQLNDGQLRFSGQVIDASGKVLAGLKATGAMRDFFGIEDSIADQVHAALNPAPMLPPTVAAVPSAPTTAPATNAPPRARVPYAWDRDLQPNLPGDYYSQALQDSYQPSYWPAYDYNNNPYAYGYPYAYGWPYYGNYGFIQSGVPFPAFSRGQGPQQAVGNVPGPVINTMQGALPNTMQGGPRNTMQNRH